MSPSLLLLIDFVINHGEKEVIKLQNVIPLPVKDALDYISRNYKENISLDILADRVHHYLKEDMEKGTYPPYKASGMAYIRFAKEEKELFKLLFMRDRSHENKEENREEIKPLLELIQQVLGIDEEDAYLFHIEMWIYVHGIATMLATSYLEWDEMFISKVITDGFEGMKTRYIEGKTV